MKKAIAVHDLKDLLPFFILHPSSFILFCWEQP